MDTNNCTTSTFTRQVLETGFLFGLVTSLFDSLYMFVPGIYYPPDYPLLLVCFNMVFWSAAGCCTVCLILLFRSFSKDDGRFTPSMLVVYVLLPFAAAYGLLGKLNIDNSLLNDAFDNHLSFLWAGLLLALPVIFSKRSAQVKTTAVSFLPELISVAALFVFCSNTARLLGIAGLADYWSWPDKDAYRIYRIKLVITYGLSIALVFGCYSGVFFASSHSWSRKRIYSTLIILVFGVYSFKTAQIITADRVHRELQPPGEYAEKTFVVPSVVLVVLDTLRADRLSLYGPDSRASTPHLVDFSHHSVVFDRCIASSSWTLPSHASLFTGLYPVEHGCRNIVSEDKWFGNLHPSKPLDESFDTLAEIFHANGYRTAGVVSNYLYLQPGFNLDQGFDMYDCKKNVGSLCALSHKPAVHAASLLLHFFPKLSKHYVVATDIRRKACSVLERLYSQPFFLFINFMDLHSPYRPPRSYSSWMFPQLFRVTSKVKGLLGLGEPMTQSEIDLAQYDAEASYVDSQLGKVFAALKKLGMYDPALIVVVSDHGELFGKNGQYGHRGVVMFDGVLHVPLMIKYPYSERTGRNDTAFPLHEVFKEILTVCDITAEEPVRYESGGDGIDPTVAEYYDNDLGLHRVLYDGPYKYLWFDSGRDIQLYNVRTDPHESNNLVDVMPEVMMRMETLLRAWEKTYDTAGKDRHGSGNVISPEMIDDLKALGYMK